MADFFHDRQYLEEGDLVVVACDHYCNVMIMDDINFEAYRNRRRFTGYGGFYKKLPVRITIPSDGWWNVTLDIARGRANVRHEFSYIKCS